MAKGAKDVDIVLELENLHAFTDFLLTKNGLVVCEVYQEWAGQCVVMKRFLKKAKFEFLEGDDWDLVTYCSIKVEAVPAFKNLRGKCIPTYLFFGGRKPVGIFRGYEPSMLMPLIKEMVRREKLCMAGKARRHVISETTPYEFPEEDQPLPELEILEVPIELPQTDDLELELMKSEPEGEPTLSTGPPAPPDSIAVTPPVPPVQQPLTGPPVSPPQAEPAPLGSVLPPLAAPLATQPAAAQPLPGQPPAASPPTTLSSGVHPLEAKPSAAQPAAAQPSAVQLPEKLDLAGVVPEHTSMQEPADSTATTVIPSPTHAAGEEVRTFDGAAPPVTHLPKSPSSEIPAHVSSEEPRRISSRASGVKEASGGSPATSTTPNSLTTPSTPPTTEQPKPTRPFQRGATAAGAPAKNRTQVTEPPGPGTANLVPVEELPTVAPSQLDETGNKANAQAAVGMVPIEENPNVENPVFTPADQAATGAVGEISIPEVHELGPGNDQGVAHVLEPATLPDANADRAASPPAESTP